jgi:hypothetical protein
VRVACLPGVFFIVPHVFVLHKRVWAGCVSILRVLQHSQL